MDAPACPARRRALLTLLAAGLPGACSSPVKLWPSARVPAPAPQPVNELVIERTAGDATALLQYWERNTLVLDLQSVSGSGQAVLRPAEGRAWPVRLGFRVAPGRIGSLEVRGEQRVIFPITADGGAGPLELRLAPGVYSAHTERIELRWGRAGGT